MHGLAEEAETGRKRNHQNGKPKPELTEKGGGKAGKTKTRTSADVMKGLKDEDELETINLENRFGRGVQFGGPTESTKAQVDKKTTEVDANTEELMGQQVLESSERRS